MAEISRAKGSDANGSPVDRSPFAEGMVSGLVALIVLIGVVSNLPGGEIQRLLMPVVKPIAVVTGLEQRWTMFAPDPPRRIENLEVRVTLADGQSRVWTPSLSAGRAVGMASSPRWRKLKETLVTQPQVRSQLAHWVVGELIGPGERAVRVQIILRTEELPPLGSHGPRPSGVVTLYDDTVGKQ